MNILITGGSGYLGRALTQQLLTNTLDVPRGTSSTEQDVPRGTSNNTINITWVSRNSDTKSPAQVTVITYQDLTTTEQNFDIIINLAGAGIADKRWSDKRKQLLLNSRLQPTQAIIDYINRVDTKPKLCISGSAIGWYGKQERNDSTVLTESHDFITDDFAHQLCDRWEQLALTISDIPVAIVRTGVVLSSDGGMISKLKLPFSLGLGGCLGDGQQMMSWISLNDWVRAVIFIIEQNCDNNKSLPQTQIYNLTAPNPVTNSEFTKAIGKWLHRPTVFAQPTFLLKMIFAEMVTLLIDGQRVIPQALLDNGFTFEDVTINDCFD